MSNFNNTHISCFLTKFAPSVFWWKPFNLLNVLLPNDLVVSGIFIMNKNFCFNFSKNNWLSQQYHRLPWSILMALKFFAYDCHCSVDTELIDRKNNAINCINCVHICSDVYRQFSTSFALESAPGQWSRCTESRMSTFCKFQQHFLCNVIPDLWAIRGRIPFLFGTCSNRPLSNTKSYRKYFHDFGICQAFIFVAFSVTRDVIEHWLK